MKLVIISDTHGQHSFDLPEGDILIHCGDFTKKGGLLEIKDFMNWFEKQSFSNKVLIAGNHELGLDRGPARESKLEIITDYTERNPNLFYLENSGVEIEGLKIWGSPNTPFFYNWAFNSHRGEDIDKVWNMIPQDCNILITHGPPAGILDIVPSDRLLGPDEKIGCEGLLNKIGQLKDLKLHAFGHIHTGHGIMIKDNVTFVNASICGDRGHVVEYNPIVIEW